MRVQLTMVDYFKNIYADWKCGVSCVVIQYTAIRNVEKWILLVADIVLSPFERLNGIDDVIFTSEVMVGQIVKNLDEIELDQFFENLLLGQLVLNDVDLRFCSDKNISLYCPVYVQEPDFFVPRLEIRADRPFGEFSQINYARTNAELRTGDRPFDGLADLLSYFGLSNTGLLPQEQKITLSLHPPLDLKLDHCSLLQNKLSLRLIKRKNFPRRQVSVGLRLFPLPNLARRMQVSNNLTWSDGDESGFEYGQLLMELDNASAVEVMLSAAGSSVRRQFFFDREKSLNPRLEIYRRFDPNLSHLKEWLDPPPQKSRHLEAGIATLLHLLGASCLTPPLTDAPDLIAETPGKRTAVIECTIKVHDLREKAGKLVSRRNALIYDADGSGPKSDVLAILVTNQPRRQVVLDDDYLLRNQILLLTRENIDNALSNLEIPPDLDQLYLGSLERLQTHLAPLSAAVSGGM
jgi:hypothetical protein